TFLLLEALPDGTYELHLSGAHGLTDLGGALLEANDPSRDYVVRFQVQGSGRTVSDPSPTRHSSGAPDPDHPQELRALFPAELAGTVTLVRQPSAGEPPAAKGDSADYFRLTVLQEQDYLFIVTPDPGMATLPLPSVVIDGIEQPGFPQGDGTSAVQLHLLPG